MLPFGIWRIRGLGNITLSIFLQTQWYADRDGCFDEQLNVLTNESDKERYLFITLPVTVWSNDNHKKTFEITKFSLNVFIEFAEFSAQNIYNKNAFQ